MSIFIDYKHDYWQCHVRRAWDYRAIDFSDDLLLVLDNRFYSLLLYVKALNSNLSNWLSLDDFLQLPITLIDITALHYLLNEFFTRETILFRVDINPNTHSARLVAI